MYIYIYVCIFVQQRYPQDTKPILAQKITRDGLASAHWESGKLESLCSSLCVVFVCWTNKNVRTQDLSRNRLVRSVDGERSLTWRQDSVSQWVWPGGGLWCRHPPSNSTLFPPNSGRINNVRF